MMSFQKVRQSFKINLYFQDISVDIITYNFDLYRRKFDAHYLVRINELQ